MPDMVVAVSGWWLVMTNGGRGEQCDRKNEKFKKQVKKLSLRTFVYYPYVIIRIKFKKRVRGLEIPSLPALGLSIFVLFFFS